MIRSFIVFLLLAVSALPLFAALSITPSRAEIVMPAGQLYENAYTIKNEYGVPIDVGVETKDWFVLSENRTIPIGDWLRVATDTFHLGVGESKELRYQVSVPTQAVGSLVGMISLSPKTEQEQGVTLVLSVPVFVTIAGTEKTDWNINDVRFEVQGGQLQVSAMVTNTGNIHLRPVGETTIFSGKNEVARIKFNESRPVYPGSYRTILGRSGVLAKGTYKGEVKVVCAGQEKIKPFKLKVKKNGELKTTWLKK